MVALGSWAACGPKASEMVSSNVQQSAPSTPDINRSKGWSKPDDATLRERLTPMQYRVTQQDGTEPPFHNSYWDNHEDGLYVDVVTGEPLFSSADKFESGTGWPSFTKPIEASRVVNITDRSHGMARVEVRSKIGDAHLGHVFPDGPAEAGGLRYCMNSASLRFVPIQKLDEEGYGAWKGAVLTGQPPVAADTDNACALGATREERKAAGCETTFETAILAGGCFWGMEDLLRKIPGVLETDVGYIGGNTQDPTYNTVHTGRTGHAESVRVVFDPKLLSYADLLEKWFFRMHDPTTENRQGNDVGTQYRSAIFTTTPEQAKIAAEVKAKVDASHFWKKPIVTQIVPAGVWTDAEDYHQDYLVENPNGYTCHWMRDDPQN